MKAAQTNSKPENRAEKAISNHNFNAPSLENSL